MLRPTEYAQQKNGAKRRYPANFVDWTLPPPRVPAVAQMCSGAFPLLFEGTAEAGRRRLVSS
jgi:hypothetical protein